MDVLLDKNALVEGYLLHWYEITRVIGRGGFGITYLAHDTNLDRSVAIKEFMPEDFATRESDDTVNPKTGEQKKLYDWGLERFIAEARTLAKFNHPNIVRVLSVFEENNTAYMVMEYAQGQDLSVIYKASPAFTQDQLLDTFIPILDGLSLVHNAGFIHRDIKPANIYICDNDSPLLLDFGSARQSLGGKTRALTSLVTYGYAPYEQYNEGTGKQGPWTDIYSLGASMYYGITGKKPQDALVRGGSFLEKGIDVYEPVSILAKGDYADNFLLAIDNALMFKLNERPGNVIEWADMLLGKTPPPALPEYMTRYAENDETVVRAWPTSGTDTDKSVGLSKKIHSGRQGLIDASGRRNSSRNDLKVGINTQREQQALQESLSKINDLEPAPATSNIKKISLILSLLAVLVTGVVFIFGDYLKDTNIKSTADVISSAQRDNQKSQQQAKNQLKKKQLDELLIRAQQALDIGDYTVPKNNNAYDFYRRVLKLEPHNRAAKRGLKNLEKELLNRASAAYIDKQYKQSLAYLNQLKKVNPKSVSAKSLRERLNTEKNKSSQISNWLAQAKEHLKNNRYTSPKNKNAYETYRKILNRQPGNKQAQQGIEKIQQHYKALFKRHISASRLSSAERDIRVMKNIDVSSADISKMQKILTAKKKKQAAKKAVIKMPVTKKLTIDQVSQKISQFKVAIEQHHKNRLKNISRYSPGREQFVKQLLSQYKKINVKISRLKLIPATNSAQAYVELKDLVDSNGNEVAPGSWSRFEISLRYTSKNELKVVW